MRLNSVVKGTKKNLEEVNDEAFAAKMMGDGVAIMPSDGVIVAPADGTVLAIFPTNHAIGMKLDNDIEVLIHVGIDTVEMKGKGFKGYVSQNESVKKGDKLIKFNIHKIIASGYEPDVMVIITNSSNYHRIEKTNADILHTNDWILDVE